MMFASYIDKYNNQTERKTMFMNIKKNKKHYEIKIFKDIQKREDVFFKLTLPNKKEVRLFCKRNKITPYNF